MPRFLLALVLVLSLPLAPRAETDLKAELETLTAKMPATVGIAVIIDGRETVTVNNDQRFPLMSVFKFHQALAVADRLAARGQPLETEIWVTKEDLAPDTWSPCATRALREISASPWRSSCALLCNSRTTTPATSSLTASAP